MNLVATSSHGLVLLWQGYSERLHRNMGLCKCFYFYYYYYYYYYYYTGISILWDSYFLPLESEPRLMLEPPSPSYSLSHLLFQEMEQQLGALLHKNAIEEMPSSTPGFYSRIFLAPKRTGHWRLVINLGALKRHLLSLHFRMETAASIVHSLQLDTRRSPWTSRMPFSTSRLPEGTDVTSASGLDIATSVSKHFCSA